MGTPWTSVNVIVMCVRLCEDWGRPGWPWPLSTSVAMTRREFLAMMAVNRWRVDVSRRPWWLWTLVVVLVMWYLWKKVQQDISNCQPIFDTLLLAVQLQSKRVLCFPDKFIECPLDIQDLKRCPSQKLPERRGWVSWSINTSPTSCGILQERGH